MAQRRPFGGAARYKRLFHLSILALMRIFTRFLFLTAFFWLSALACLSSLAAQCAGAPGLDLYWVGAAGSGDYNDPANWRVGSVASTQQPCQSPRSSDNVFFTAAAFPSAGAVVTVNASANCNNMIWSDAISTNPRFFSPISSVNLSVYGALELATNMQFDYRGILGFYNQTGATVHIRTRGHNLQITSFIVEVSAASTFLLSDALSINNRYNNNVYQDEGGIWFNSGHFNSNGQAVSADFFRSNNGNSSRRLTIDNSTIIIDGAIWARHIWWLDFNGVSNHAGFSATNSHLVIRPATETPSTYVDFGYDQQYGDITIDGSQSSNGSHRLHFYNLLHANNFNIAANSVGLLFEYNLRLRANTVNIGENSVVIGRGGEFRTSAINVLSAGCGFAILQGGAADNFWIEHTNPGGTLVMNNLVLSGCIGNVAGGRSYVANNSVNGGAVSNITINPTTTCNTDLYFRDKGNQRWDDPNNWEDAGGNISTHAPSPANNVFFDAASFPSTARCIIPTARMAFCKDMLWAGTPAGADLQLNNSLAIFGNLQLAPNMDNIQEYSTGFEYSRGFVFHGNNVQVVTHGKTISSTIFTMPGSRVHIIDTLHVDRLYQYGGSEIVADNVGMTIVAYWLMGRRDLSNTRIYMTGAGWNALSETDNSLINYTNGTRLHLRGADLQMVNGRLPTTYIENPKVHLNDFLIILGDLHIVSNCPNLTMQNWGYSGSRRIDVTGNMYIAPGVEVVMGDNPGSYIRIGGNLDIQGSCTQMTTLKSYSGSPVELRVNGTSNVNYAYIANMNAINPINTTNSIDGGGNTNINFPPVGITQNYYWRADMTNPTDFDGNWSDPNHWTTNPLSPIGDGACLPSINDNVFFDAQIQGFTASAYSCVINTSAFANNFSALDAVRLEQVGNGLNALNVKGNFSLANTTTWSFTGLLNFIGGGDINTAAKTMQNKEIVFNSTNAGTWTLQSPLTLASIDGYYYGILKLFAGTLNTNNFSVDIHNSFNASSSQPRGLILGTSVWTMHMLGQYDNNTLSRWAWNVADATNMSISAGGSTIRFLNGNYATNFKRLQMGDGLNYNIVEILDTDEQIRLHSNANYNYLVLNSNVYIDGNNTMDSLSLGGGYFYQFNGGSIQTLRAPHGKIIANGSSSNFVNIESRQSGSPFTIHKAYGNAFCVDFAKVRDCIATKENNMALVPTTPIDYQLIHPFLEFQTGTNSDNIGGTATGIWAFNLPVLVTPQYAGANTVQICALTTPSSFNIPVTGTSPYVINYTWTSGSSNGAATFIANDDDANSSTPVFVAIPINTTNPNITYTFNITTLRCGEETTPITRNVTVQQPAVNALTNIQQTATCSFNNAPQWLTLIGSSNQRPMLSIMDYTGASDNSALGSVQAHVDFTATTQTVSIGGIATPYLRRFWTITPTNNGAAFVRLYFTQTELNTLAAAPTYAGTYAGTLNPATQIQVVRYASGAVGVGAEQIIPHTVTPLVGAAADPFSSTTDVICVEFYVPSFSAFIIIPTQEAFLPLELQSFEAQKYSEREALISWTVTEAEQTARYEIERSTDGVQGSVIGEVASRRRNSEDSYQWIDARARSGYNYYRLRSIDDDGTVHFSAWRTVLFGEEQHSAQLLPNPTKSAATLRLGAAARVEVRIFNALGQLAYSERFDAATDAFSLPIAHLPSGVYSVQVLHTDSRSAQTLQLVKE